MYGIFNPKRFLSFLLLSFLFLGLQSFVQPDFSPNRLLKSVIIEIDEVFFNFVPNEDEGPVWVWANPAQNNQWINVMCSEEIEEFEIKDANGVPTFKSDIDSDMFRFQTNGYDAGIYYLEFLANGTLYHKTLLLE